MSNAPTPPVAPPVELAEIKADIRDVLYAALAREFDGSDEALDAAMPHVRRYAAVERAVELRDQAAELDELASLADRSASNSATGLRRAAMRLRVRANDLLDGGGAR